MRNKNMDIVQESKKLALSEIEKFKLPDLVHFEISEKKALELTDKLGADKKIVQIGIYLMDLKLGESFRNGSVSDHVQKGIDVAKKFLEEFDIDEISKKKIINCIEAHHGDVEFGCIEAEICANADCYRFIHPRGFFAYIALLGKRFDSIDDCLRQAEVKLDEKKKILSLDICKEELDDYYKEFKKMIQESIKW